MHGAENLNVLCRNAETPRDALLDELHAQLRGPFRLLSSEQKEIFGLHALLAGRPRQYRRLTAVDAMGILDDIAACRLSKDPVQPHHGRIGLRT